jgi:hypothetical protein
MCWIAYPLHAEEAAPATQTEQPAPPNKQTSKLPEGETKQIVHDLTTRIDKTRDKVDDSMDEHSQALEKAVSEQQ